ncbi:MAG: type II toxin-antitoxin system death-on-curing family toxin [Gemmatimonadales bacterium]
MRYLTLGEVLELYTRIMTKSGGSAGLRDLGALESALAQPRASFGGVDLYPTLAEKAVALGFSLIRNHPFRDGNKRIGHAALEATLMLNGHELRAEVADAEATVLAVAEGSCSREQLLEWVRIHAVPLTG